MCRTVTSSGTGNQSNNNYCMVIVLQVWLRNIQNLLKRDMGDAAQKAFDQSLLSLPRRKHVKVISQVAIMEFKIGSPERGRTIFEGVVRNYPRRTDLWSVYLDQVSSHNSNVLLVCFCVFFVC